MSGEKPEQLQAELTRVQGAKKTREASEALAKFVKDNEGADPLVSKQAENPYLMAPKGMNSGGCCTVS